MTFEQRILSCPQQYPGIILNADAACAFQRRDGETALEYRRRELLAKKALLHELRSSYFLAPIVDDDENRNAYTPRPAQALGLMHAVRKDLEWQLPGNKVAREVQLLYMMMKEGCTADELDTFMENVSPAFWTESRLFKTPNPTRVRTIFLQLEDYCADDRHLMDVDHRHLCQLLAAEHECRVVYFFSDRWRVEQECDLALPLQTVRQGRLQFDLWPRVVGLIEINPRAFSMPTLAMLESIFGDIAGNDDYVVLRSRQELREDIEARQHVFLPSAIRIPQNQWISGWENTKYVISKYRAMWPQCRNPQLNDIAEDLFGDPIAALESISSLIREEDAFRDMELHVIAAATRELAAPGKIENREQWLALLMSEDVADKLEVEAQAAKDHLAANGDLEGYEGLLRSSPYSRPLEKVPASTTRSKCVNNQVPEGHGIQLVKETHRLDDASLRKFCREQWSIDKLEALRRPMRMIPVVMSAFTQLRLEFPWMIDIIGEIERQQLRSIALGREWFQFSPILLIGEPGCGKTRFALRLAQIMGVESRLLQVGGSDNNRSAAGTSRGWANGQPSIFVDFVASTSTANPMMIVDEIDKVCVGRQHANILDTLLQVLEPQNAMHYIDDCLQIVVDLSRMNWILTGNSLSDVPKALLSRVMLLKVDQPKPEHFDQIVRSARVELAERYEVGVDWIPYLTGDEVEIVKKAASVREGVKIAQRIIDKRFSAPDAVMH
jgi:hypothetical protein